MVGDESWTFENLLPYFKRSCTFNPPDQKRQKLGNETIPFDPKAFSEESSGPLQISFPNWSPGIGSWAKIGMQKALGVQPTTKGFNSGALVGSGPNSATINPVNGHRCSSQTSFLSEALEGTSIKVYTRTMALRLHFDGDKTARAIQVETAGKKYRLKTRKEIILSAGAFQSPQILMLSGIGPRDTLNQHGIPVVSELPGVGQNLQDQTYFGVSYRVNLETASKFVNDPSYAAQADYDFLNFQSGPLTSGPAYIGWEKLSADALSKSTVDTLRESFPEDWPHIEYLAESAFDGYNKNYAKSDPGDGYNYATISAALVAPLSVGNVSIKSASATDAPLINPNWLTHAVDLEVMVAAFKRVRRIWRSMGNVTIGEEYFPSVSKVESDAEILDHIRSSAIQLWHAAATCKMGELNDPMAVIDTKARVRGFQRLRVVDASSFPFLPPGQCFACIQAESISTLENSRS